MNSVEQQNHQTYCLYCPPREAAVSDLPRPATATMAKEYNDHPECNPRRPPRRYARNDTTPQDRPDTSKETSKPGTIAWGGEGPPPAGPTQGQT